MPEQPVAVVTGATGGIGRWIALGLARAGCRVIMVARDEGRADATRRWIVGQVPAAATEIVTADLSLMAHARRAGEEIGTRHQSLALLVNNAGLITRTRRVTAEGREAVLAVNHLAPFVLTGTLDRFFVPAAPPGW